MSGEPAAGGGGLMNDNHHRPLGMIARAVRGTAPRPPRTGTLIYRLTDTPTAAAPTLLLAREAAGGGKRRLKGRQSLVGVSQSLARVSHRPNFLPQIGRLACLTWRGWRGEKA